MPTDLRSKTHQTEFQLARTQNVNGVNVLVPGQILSAHFPNHIVLNTVSKEAGWETSSREWIPEDGLYNHLVVKLPRE